MAQGMTYKDFEARMAAARAAHLRNIDITGKKIQGIYTQAARDLAKRAEATRAGTLTERWVKDYQKSLEKRIEQMRGELGGTILSGMRKSAGLPGDTVEGWLNDALAMVGVDGSFTGTFSRTPDAALRMLIDGRMYRDGKSLSRRICNSCKAALKISSRRGSPSIAARCKSRRTWRRMSARKRKCRSAG